MMNHGRIEQFGTPEEVYLKPATAFVAGFLGAFNWFDEVGIRLESTRVTLDKAEGLLAEERLWRALCSSATAFTSSPLLPTVPARSPNSRATRTTFARAKWSGFLGSGG